MKKRLSLILVLCAGLFTACAKEEKVVTTAFKGEYVVSSSYAKQKFEDENTILVHVKKEESKKTIDSSVSMDYDYLTKSTTEDEEVIIENIFDKKELSKKLGALGLDRNKEIILFANDNSGVDGKILYQLLVAGYDYVKIVDGGYDSLINVGFEEGNPKKLEPIKINIKEIEDNNIITDKELKDNYEDFVVVSLDKKSDLKEVINLNYEDLFTKDKTLNSIKDIKTLVKDLGIKSDDKIVIHSSDGIKSAYVQVILKMSGYEYARYYDEAYYDSDDEKVVEKEAEEEITEVSSENTNERANESTESTTKPNTNTNTNTNTNGSTGSTTTRPNTNASTGSTTTRPNTNGSSGSTTTNPGTDGSTGSTTKPDTDSSTDSTIKPETDGSNSGTSSDESGVEE